MADFAMKLARGPNKTKFAAPNPYSSESARIKAMLKGSKQQISASSPFGKQNSNIQAQNTSSSSSSSCANSSSSSSSNTPSGQSLNEQRQQRESPLLFKSYFKNRGTHFYQYIPPPPALPSKAAQLEAQLSAVEEELLLKAKFQAFTQEFLGKLKQFSGSCLQIAVVADGVCAMQCDQLVMPLKSQVLPAKQTLTTANKELKSDMGKTKAKVEKGEFDAEQVFGLVNSCGVVGTSAAFLVAAVKALVLEVTDVELFRRTLRAATTVRTMLDLLITVIDGATIPNMNMSASLHQLKNSSKSVEASLSMIISAKANVMGNLVSLGTKLELVAAARAATASVMRLVYSFEFNTTNLVVNEAKVAASTIFQFTAVLNSCVKSLTGTPKDLLEKASALTKSSLGSFIETARVAAIDEQAKKKENLSESLRSSAQDLLNAMQDAIITASILSKVDSCTEKLPEATPEDEKEAKEAVSVPPNVMPLKAPTEEKEKEDDDDPTDKENVNIWEEPEDNAANIVLKENGKIKYANLNKLVERLTSMTYTDLKFLYTFLTTYRSFTTPYILLQKLMERFLDIPETIDEKHQDVIRLRVCNVIKNWVDMNFWDFDDNLLAKLDEFLELLYHNHSTHKHALSIRAAIKRKLMKEDPDQTLDDLSDLRLEPKIPLTPSRLLMVFDEEEIARQITLVDFNLYTKIEPVELLNQAWSKPKLKHRSPNVLRLIARSTQLTKWVSSVVLWQPTLKERSRVLSKLINIADHLRKLNNLNSVTAFVAAINSAAVHRLKHTRAALPESSQKVFEELDDLLNPNQSYLNYRTALRKVNPPCVPFLGVYLTDLTFIEDGNLDFVDGLVNHGKRELIYNVISEIQQYQHIHYDFPYVDHIAHFLTELPVNTENEVYSLSLYREARGGSKPA